MTRRRQNSLDDISSQAFGWLGSAAKVVGRAAAQNPLVAQNIRYGKAALDGPAALAKTAAIDLAAGAAGRVVTKGASIAARAVVKTGVPARVANKVTGQTVFVHGSPTPNLSKLETFAGSRALPNEKVVYGWDPSTNNAQNWLTKNSATIINARGNNASSVYIAKAPTKSVKNRADDVNWNVVTSSTPAKVVKELPIPSNIGDEYSETFKQFDKRVLDAVKQAGGKLAKTPKPPKRKNINRGVS